MILIWLTGRPCSGKTTIGVRLRDMLNAQEWRTELLDGDLIRRNLWPEIGFSLEDRNDNVRRFSYLSEILVRHDIFTIVSAVSPYRASRLAARNSCKYFLEVYVDAPLEICEERDVKGMYKKAREGKIPDFTGVNHPYEPPLSPEVTCRTNMETVDESAQKVFDAVNLMFDMILETEAMKGVTA